MRTNLRRGSIKAAGSVPSETEPAIKPSLFADRSRRFGDRGCLCPPVEVKSQIQKPERVFSSESQLPKALPSVLDSVGLLSPSLALVPTEQCPNCSPRTTEAITNVLTVPPPGRRVRDPREQIRACVALSPRTWVQTHFDPNILSLVFLASSGGVVNNPLA